ncbi:MAG: hypothetical protein ACTSXG_01235 [Alphaproteobacteria bacterium]
MKFLLILSFIFCSAVHAMQKQEASILDNLPEKIKKQPFLSIANSI